MIERHSHRKVVKEGEGLPVFRYRGIKLINCPTVIKAAFPANISQNLRSLDIRAKTWGMLSAVGTFTGRLSGMFFKFALSLKSPFCWNAFLSIVMGLLVTTLFFVKRNFSLMKWKRKTAPYR